MNHLLRRLLACAVVIVAVALVSAPPPAAGSPAQVAIAGLNAQRAANGIPAGIVERPDWSRACEQHMAYVRQNGELTHHEDPSKPGYTDEGNWAGGTSVLHGGSAWWEGGRNPWENAPIHLMQLLAPALSETGAAVGCMVTWAGYNRPVGAFELFSYPGDGQRDWPFQERASESPFVPGDFVGLPEGTTTGPHIYILAPGGVEGRGRLTAATLTGPTGPVDIRTVDNSTTGERGKLGNYLPPGGIVIPTAPLAPGATYAVHASFETTGRERKAAARSFTFTTAKRPTEASVHIHEDGVELASNRADPADVTVVRLPSGTAVWSGQLTAGAARALRLPGARYRACFAQAETAEYAAASGCEEGEWRSSPVLRLARAGRRRGSRLQLGLRASEMLDGATATLRVWQSARRCRRHRAGHRSCGHRRVGRVRSSRIALQPATTLTLPLPRGRRLVHVRVRVAEGGNGDWRFYSAWAGRTLRR